MKGINYIDIGPYKVAFEVKETANAKACILMVHGMGEHCWRYNHVVDYFVEQDLNVIRFDLPGHGLSSGKRGHIKSYDEVLDCVDYFLGLLNDYNVPSFLFGHSMGGNIVLGELMYRKPKLVGAIVASPWVALTFKMGFFKSLMATIASKLIPAATKKNALAPEILSKDIEVVNQYQSDSLVHDAVSPRLFVEMSRVATMVQLRASRIRTHTLLYHGSGDQLTAPWATKAVADAMPNSKFILYDSGYHEMHNEPNKKEVLENIGQFINERLATLVPQFQTS
ncbi:alpha/beta hydrolase [Luteibaculum oceani]|nr:alpha/beta hydrolase [Luteibaculum oceani]